MTEKLADVGRGISLAYEEIGEPDADPIVLVAGLGQQLQSWPKPFCERLAAGGRRVIRFDNRDVGHSTHLAFRPPRPKEMFLQRWSLEQYDLADMAADTVGLLDAIGIESADVVGISMGGMIAQTVAALYPARVRTLTSIMSTTGSRLVGRPAVSTLRRLFAPPPRSREEAMERAVGIFRHVGSHGFARDEAWIRELAGSGWDRDPSTAGVGRQLAAIFKSGNRTRRLRAITAPTLVIHGDRDRMVHPTGGAATVRAINGSRLETVVGMGHDLPQGAWPTLLQLIDAHAQPATTRSTDVSPS